jgi:hypothetical protein
VTGQLTVVEQAAGKERGLNHQLLAQKQSLPCWDRLGEARSCRRAQRHVTRASLRAQGITSLVLLVPSVCLFADLAACQ